MNTEAAPLPAVRRMPWRRLALAALALAAVLWFAHPFILGWLLRVGLEQAAARAGYELEIGRVDSGLNRPVVLERVNLRSKDPSQTVVDVARAQFSFNWPWRAFFGEKRFFREVVAEDVRAIWDCRKTASEPVAERKAGRILQTLPERLVVRQASAEILTPGRSWYLQDFSAEFDERKLGTIEAAGAEITRGDIRQTLGTLKGETAWKKGSLYIADVAVQDGVRVENFEMQLARPEGLALALEASVFGGGLRADVAYGTDKKMPTVEVALWMSNIDIAPLSVLLGWKGKAEGTIKEGRLTFRGTPAQALDGQASLRLAAQDFRWNDRGWESLELGASMIHRRLSVSDFSLRQKDNTLSGNGEVSLAGGWSDLAKAPFLLNVSASIKNLGALAGLLGSPFDEMTGRMSLSSSISGQDGKLGGYLSMEGSDMGFRKHPVESGRVEVAFANTEAQIAQCELWSGVDYLRAKGAVDIASPHNYSGEVQASLRDIASYVDLVRPLKIPAIFAGSAQVRWQGDGSAASHSGAFNVSLDELGSEFSPTGLTGRFAGTYSPQNLYFSGFELEQGSMRFTTRATLAGSGINLTNAELRVGGRPAGEADVFLPLDPFALLTGKSLAEAALPEKKVYASLQTSQPVNLRDLFRLMGRDFSGEGKASLNFTAAGSPEAPQADGKIEVRGLVSRDGSRPGPVSQLNASLQVSEGVARLDGVLAPKGSAPVTLKAEAPLGLVKDKAGAAYWMNPEGPVSVQLDLPKTELIALQPLLPVKLQLQGGVATGQVAVAGTVAHPKFTGALALQGGRLQSSPGDPVVDNLRASLRFEETKAVLENMTGTVASGMFDLRGEISLADVTRPQSEFFFTGRNLLLANDPGLRLLANADLKAVSDGVGGAISGSIHLVDGQIYRRLEVMPVVGALDVEQEAFPTPRFDGFTPGLAVWKLDVKVKGETPFAIGGNVALGQVIPDLHLTGTLEKPVPEGRVEIKNTRAFLPYTILTIRDGFLSFTEAEPWVPQVDIRAEGQALDYAVQAYAFGPLNKRRLILRSEPPLEQDALILLLTTGMPPGMEAKTQALQSPGALAQPLNPRGTGASLLAAPIQLAAEPGPGAPMTARGRFELWRKLTLTSEREGLGGYEAGLTYQLRFQ